LGEFQVNIFLNAEKSALPELLMLRKIGKKYGIYVMSIKIS